MKKRLLLLIVLAACLSSAIAVQTDSERARNQVNEGLQDVKQYHYESAIEHFRQAHQLDPQSRQATLYLAGALALNYVPGVDTPDNLKLGKEAIETYKQLLALDPQNVTAFKSLGALALAMRNLEEAKSYFRQANQANPNDPDAFYCIGVVDWIQAYKRRADERAKRGLSMNGPPSITQPFCAKLRTNNLPMVEDGIQAMKKAIELRPDYADAMAYLSLLFRERSDIQCNDKATRANDEREANQWTDKAIATGQRRADASKDSEPSATQSPESLLSEPPLPPPPPPPPPPPAPKKPPKIIH